MSNDQFRLYHREYPRGFIDLKIFQYLRSIELFSQLGDESQKSVKKDGILLQYPHLVDCGEPGIIVWCYFASAYHSTYRMNAAMIHF